MKKLCIVLSLFLLLTGCASQQPEPTSTPTPSSELALTGNIFLDAEQTISKTAGGGINNSITVNKEDALAAPAEDYAAFTDRINAYKGTIETYTLRFGDSTGVVYYGADPSNANYGSIDDTGSIVEPYGAIIPDESGSYSYLPFDDGQANSTANTFDLSAYKDLVADCRAKIKESGILLSNIGQWENNYWKAMGSLSDDMVGSAFEWLEEQSGENRDTVDSGYSDIRDTYKEIILLEVEGKEAEEIDEAFRGLYDSYSSLYRLVTEPSGSRSDFVDDFNDSINAFTTHDDTLSLFLEG